MALAQFCFPTSLMLPAHRHYRLTGPLRNAYSTANAVPAISFIYLGSKLLALRRGLREFELSSSINGGRCHSIGVQGYDL
jgi:hypothetical protein